MTAPCSNLHYLLSLHPHYNCCHGRLSVIYIECLESDGQFYHNDYNGNPPDEMLPCLDGNHLVAMLNARGQNPMVNLCTQVIIYGGIQQNGIILSVHTKTVNTSMKR